jgi:hypothetical protein
VSFEDFPIPLIIVTTFRLLKIQRIIFNAENSLKHFLSNCFTIINLKFIDLNIVIPAHEKKDFFINETQFSNLELYKEAYQIGLQEIFKERAEDLPKARQRFFFVKLIVRTMQSIILLTVSAILIKCLNGSSNTIESF